MKKGTLRQMAVVAAIFAGAMMTGRADTAWTGTSTEDVFVTTGSDGSLANGNFGGAGTLAISPAGTTKGEFESLLKFTLSGTGGAAAKFDAQYGTGNWHITGISLTLAGNFAVSGMQPNNPVFNTINGGSFAISWMSDDSWLQGTGNPGSPTTDGVTYNTLGTFLTSGTEALGIYNYVPPGNNVPLTWNLNLTTGFLADATSSNQLSFLFNATLGSSVGYLFNSNSFPTIANRPVLTISAIPEPAALPLLLGGATALAMTFRGLRRRVQ